MELENENKAFDNKRVIQIFTDEEIRQQAKDFCNKWLPKFEKHCEICGACNCKNNDSCIKCNCQF